MGRRALPDNEKRQKIFFRLSPENTKRLRWMVRETGETKTQILESAVSLYSAFIGCESRAGADVRDALSKLNQIHRIEDSPSVALFYDPLIERSRKILKGIKRVHPDLQSLENKQLAYDIMYGLTVSSVFLSGIHHRVMKPIRELKYQEEYEEKLGAAWERREWLLIEKGLKVGRSDVDERGRVMIKPIYREETLEEIEADIRRLEALPTEGKEVKKE